MRFKSSKRVNTLISTPVLTVVRGLILTTLNTNKMLILQNIYNFTINLNNRSTLYKFTSEVRSSKTVPINYLNAPEKRLKIKNINTSQVYINSPVRGLKINDKN